MANSDSGHVPATAEPCLADDILRGADEIAAFLGIKKRRQIYHAVENGAFPTFRVGAIVCARKSKLLAWIGDQERASVSANG